MAMKRLVRLFLLVALLCALFKSQPALSSAGAVAALNQPANALATTVQIYASTNDVEIINQNCSSWSNCRNASTAVLAFQGLGVSTINASYSLGQYGPYIIKRIFQFYDTSAIPLDATISAVSLHFRSGQFYAGNQSIHVVSSTANISPTLSDFGRLSFVSGGSVMVPGLNTWSVINLNQGARGWIAKGGTTKLALISALDQANTVPTSQNELMIHMAEDPTYRPYIEVTYTSTGDMFSVSGKVTDLSGAPLEGAIVVDNAGHSSQTGSDGIYVLSGVRAGNYTLTPTKMGFSFSPGMRSISVADNLSGQDFTGSGDSDGDSLADVWEVLGYDANGDGRNEVDLPAMGADPNHRDIFVEVDYMEEKTCLGGVCVLWHTHKPNPDAIAKVVAAFKDAPVSNLDGVHGINLHVDFGPETPMRPGQNWGGLSHSGLIPHKDLLSIDDVDAYSRQAFYFDAARSGIFHYVIFAHNLQAEGNSPCTSGIGYAPGWNFLVTLGGWGQSSYDDCTDWRARNSVGTPFEQAGTFMHELGHNLGLNHGGGDGVNNKPNYLSVMNYTFQTSGLIYDGKETGTFDYSRSDQIPALNEAHLNETVGLNGGSSTAMYGTRWTCPNRDVWKIINANNPIDWNCDGDLAQTDVAANINNTENSPTVAGETLNGYFDWSHLVYNGGGASSASSTQSTAGELMVDISLDEDNRIPREYKANLVGEAGMRAIPGSSMNYTFTLTNLGESEDTYTFAASSDAGWADLSTMPASVTLASGASNAFTIRVSIPAGITTGQADTLYIEAASAGNPLVVPSVNVVTQAVSAIHLPLVMR